MPECVLISGAGTGLGRATALHLAQQGWRVYASVPDPAQIPELEAAAREQGCRLENLILDVTDEASIAAALEIIIAREGRIDALVNNAGISLRGYFEDLDEDEIRRLFDVNFFGALAVTRAVLPYMRRAGCGRIVFISSIGGRIASMARTAYCASKFGLEGFAESLYQEVRPLGLHVSIVEPAITKTERWTVNRGVARRALDERSPYLNWFREQERLADQLVRSSPTTAQDVAVAVEAALSDPDPQLRYLVGQRAGLVLALRRYLPGELFERIYFGAAMRRVTRGQRMENEQADDDGEPGSRGKRLLSIMRTIKLLGFQQTRISLQLKRLSNETIRGFYMTRTIIALINLGFFKELNEIGAVYPVSFAHHHQLSLPLLNSLCKYLYEIGILDYDGEYVVFAPRGRLMLSQLQGAFEIVYGYEDVFYHLEALLRQERHYGVEVKRRSAYVARGSGGVGRLLAFPLVIDILVRLNVSQVLDLGCGDGTFLGELCLSQPSMAGYGVDIASDAIAAGNQRLQQQGLGQRVRLYVGDIFDLEQIRDQMPGIEAATSIYVLHEFYGTDGKHLVEVLRGFRTTFPGIPLVLCEVIRHESAELRARPGGISEIQLFHNLSNQTLLSRSQWHALFERAGYAHIQEEYLDVVRTSVFVVQ